MSLIVRNRVIADFQVTILLNLLQLNNLIFYSFYISYRVFYEEARPSFQTLFTAEHSYTVNDQAMGSLKVPGIMHERLSVEV